MRTPAGSECPYYFEDFHRGRNRQECRLIQSNPDSARWASDLCTRCSVPRISRANACPNLVLHANVRPGILGIGRGVTITSSCTLTKESVDEPQIGCGHCHEAFEFPLQSESAE